MAGEPFPIPLDALQIVVSPVLAGGKKALQFGDGPVHVSPAMYDLAKHASPEELKTLLRSIELLRLPALPSVFGPVPMLTEPPASFTDDSVVSRYLRNSVVGRYGR